MSTEKDTWRDASSAEENSGAGRDGNQFNKEGGYSLSLIHIFQIRKSTFFCIKAKKVQIFRTF